MTQATQIQIAQQPITSSFNIPGVYRINDFSIRVRNLYRTGLTPGASTGWAELNQFYTVKKGQLTILTGIPGHGKSAFLDSLLINLAEQHGWKFVICSAENQPLERHVASLMEIKSKKPFTVGHNPMMTPDEAEAAEKWLNEHFIFIKPDEISALTLQELLRICQEVHKEFPIDGVVIDPWNELEHSRPERMSETEYISHSLSAMRKFARANEAHVWLVSHPTKLQKDLKTNSYPVPTLYDISGSAHFRNKADFGISVWRDVLNDHMPTEIHIQKVRFRETGKVGKAHLVFDKITGRFNELPSPLSVAMKRKEASKATEKGETNEFAGIVASIK
jgi:twinkle protein